MRIIDTFFDKFRSQEAQFKNMSEEVEAIEEVLEGIFYFSLIWGLGVTTDEKGREAFNNYLKDLIQIKAIDKRYALPDKDTVYDYLFDPEKKELVDWKWQLLKIDENTANIRIPGFTGRPSSWICLRISTRGPLRQMSPFWRPM